LINTSENNNNSLRLTHDFHEIEQAAITHFQSISGSKHNKSFKYIDELPQDWQEIFAPRSNITQHSLNQLTKQISMDELESALKCSSNNKANGPSNISYEDLKHLQKDSKSILLKIFNLCI
jgi:hypothetical protein